MIGSLQWKRSILKKQQSQDIWLKFCEYGVKIKSGRSDADA